MGERRENSDERKGVWFVAADKMLEGDMNTFADSLGFSLDTKTKLRNTENKPHNIAKAAIIQR